MADFLKTCQAIVKYVKKFLEEANFNTPEVNQRLERLNEVAVILSSLEQDGVVNVSQEWLERTRKLCEGLLFGDWMRLTTTMACHSSFFNGVETIKLPSHMQKKVDEVTKYSKKCQDILESTDKIMSSLIEKVGKAKDDNHKGIPDKDIRTLKTDIEDLECNLEISKIYLDSSREAFNQLKSDIDAEAKWNEKVKNISFVAGCLAASITIGGGVLYVSLPVASKMGAVQKFSEFLGGLAPAKLAKFMIGGGLSSTALAFSIYGYLVFYDKKLYETLSAVKGDLREAKTQYYAQKKEFDMKLKKEI